MTRLVTDRDQDASAQPPRRVRRSRWNRFARVIGIAALTLTGVLVASTATNLLLEQSERAQISPYGHRIAVQGGSLNVVQNGQSGPPLVLLSGLGTAAPGLDFAPLIEQLDNFSVTVVEGFGYGYSDMSATPRTVDNITTELHEALTKLDIPKPYTLVGHSIAGFYTLGYANKYRDEVAAVIGIDPTVPAGKAEQASAPTGGINWMRLLSTTGLVRGINALVPDLAEPAGDAFSASERERIRLMTNWNFGNDAETDETLQMGVNAHTLRGQTYPSDLPVLDFLASESLDTIPHWRQLHEEQLQNVTRHELVELDGGHYLHWTQSSVMAAAITDFLGQQD